MNWHTNVSVGDLHYLRSKFAQSHGADGIYLSSFLEATDAFYRSKQFRVSGDCFLTWAFLTPEMEYNYLTGSMGWIKSMSQGNPWIVEAYMPGKSLFAMKQLRSLIPTKILRFKRGDHEIGKIKLS